ncbi:MAG: hypothetical protein RIB59_13555 [Rhodospirillales bacterium]
MAVQAVELRLSKISQIFNSLDPTPFPERDLDNDAVDFIVGWAEEHPSSASLVLIVHLPESERGAVAKVDVQDSVNIYFTHLYGVERRRLRGLFRQGRISLVIGIAVLILCNLASEGLAAVFKGPFASAMLDGLIIFGWVINWRPAQIFLYDWWPVHRLMKLYERLSRMPVEIKFHPAAA